MRYLIFSIIFFMISCTQNHFSSKPEDSSLVDTTAVAVDTSSGFRLIDSIKKIGSDSNNSRTESNTYNQQTVIQQDNFRSVQIGSQHWMVDNLNVTNFRNGDVIPEAVSDEEWKSAGENGKPAWCYSWNLFSNGDKFGKLYNWHAINDPRGLAPEGWHIPTNLEWEQMIKSQGGFNEAGLHLKSKFGWEHPESGGNGDNSSGFSAFPGGIRIAEGKWETQFFDPNTWKPTYKEDESSVNRAASFWSSTSCTDNSTSLSIWIGGDKASVASIDRNCKNKGVGRSVRCVKN